MAEAMILAILGIIAIWAVVELFTRFMFALCSSRFLCSHLWMQNGYCARCGYERPDTDL